MTGSVTVTEEQFFAALTSFLSGVLLENTEIVRGLDNRVPEPLGTDFVVMWPTLKTRLAQNTETTSDVAFTGSIALGVLTVSVMLPNSDPVANGQPLTGSGMAANTVVGAQISGTPGGAGTYNVSPSQSVASTVMQSGARSLLQETEVKIQLDVHGPSSADNAQIITTLMQDGYGFDQFESYGLDVRPLYCDDPRQTGFVNENQQVEERWSITAALQINPKVSVSQQFSDALSATPVSVERTYPA